tara:strand:+ start:322 stop:747 length:426 start_codon:yes stop_codon:yes gene_type:complete
VKRLGYIGILLISSSALAETSSLNLNLPNSPRTFQQDRIRSGDLDCSNAIGSSTNVEFGVVGVLNQNNPYEQALKYGANVRRNEDFVKDVGVYARINIPIGAPKERINCNRLFKIEIEKRELELQRLRQEVANLQQLQFEN